MDNTVMLREDSQINFALGNIFLCNWGGGGGGMDFSQECFSNFGIN